MLLDVFPFYTTILYNLILLVYFDVFNLIIIIIIIIILIKLLLLLQIWVV